MCVVCKTRLFDERELKQFQCHDCFYFSFFVFNLRQIVQMYSDGCKSIKIHKQTCRSLVLEDRLNERLKKEKSLVSIITYTYMSIFSCSSMFTSSSCLAQFNFSSCSLNSRISSCVRGFTYFAFITNESDSIVFAGVPLVGILAGKLVKNDKKTMHDRCTVRQKLIGLARK